MSRVEISEYEEELRARFGNNVVTNVLNNEMLMKCARAVCGVVGGGQIPAMVRAGFDKTAATIAVRYVREIEMRET